MRPMNCKANLQMPVSSWCARRVKAICEWKSTWRRSVFEQHEDELTEQVVQVFRFLTTNRDLKESTFTSWTISSLLQLRIWKLSKALPKKCWHRRRRSDLIMMVKHLWSEKQLWIKWIRAQDVPELTADGVTAYLFGQDDTCLICDVFFFSCILHTAYIWLSRCWRLCHLPKVKYKKKNVFQIKMLFWICDTFIEKHGGMHQVVADLEQETSLTLCGICSAHAIDLNAPSLKHIPCAENKRLWMHLPSKLDDEDSVKLWSMDADDTVHDCSLCLGLACVCAIYICHVLQCLESVWGW